MIEYIYRGFKISYEVLPVNLIHSSFEARGCVTQLLKEPRLYNFAQMLALQDSHFLVEDEIKRKLEHQIDEVLSVYFEQTVG